MSVELPVGQHAGVDVVRPLRRLRLAWWNTGLSPQRKPKKRHAPQYRETVVQVARQMFETAEIDFLALGEVEPGDVSDFQNAIEQPLRTYADHDAKTGIAVLYDGTHLDVTDDLILTDRYADKELKRGCRFRLLVRGGSLDFYLFVCHWSSRMRGQAKRERNKLAASLNKHITDLRSRDLLLPVVIMGDFNDEPFDDSMTEHLLGSRDRDLVRERRTLLYNPFWRLLGEQQHIRDEGAGRLAAGTHFFASDQLTRWFTMDQALVSAPFLGGAEWVLDDAETAILQMSPLWVEGGRIRSGFDHFPIVIGIERLTK